MKPFTLLQLIIVVVCISFIHTAPISRKSHAVTEPLGFLTNFILNKRARAVSNDKPVGLQTIGATKKSSVISETPFIEAASIQIHVKAEPESKEKKGTKNQVQDDDEKPSADSSNSGPSSTTETSSWNWWQLNNKKASENSVKANPVGHRDIIKLSFRNGANIARRTTGTITVDADPVEVVEAPIVDDNPIEVVQLDVVDTVQDTVSASSIAGASSTDESTVSVATTTSAPKIINKESSVKIVANPKHRILYEDNTPNFRVTLQVIEVEFDPIHTEPFPAEAVDVKPAKIGFAVDSTATASAAGTGEISTAQAEIVAIAPVAAIVATSGPLGTPNEDVTSVSVLLNSASGGYVSQSEPVFTGVAGEVGGTAVAGGTTVAGRTVVAGGTEETGGTEDEPEEDKDGKTGAESDSAEEND